MFFLIASDLRNCVSGIMASVVSEVLSTSTEQEEVVREPTENEQKEIIEKFKQMYLEELDKASESVIQFLVKLFIW